MFPHLSDNTVFDMNHLIRAVSRFKSSTLHFAVYHITVPLTVVAAGATESKGNTPFLISSVLKLYVNVYKTS